MESNLSKDERTWAMLTHLSALSFFIIPFGHVLGPLLIWMLKKEEYPFVERQGKEALNFQISITIYTFAAGILIIILIGIPLLIGLFFMDFILVIIASLRANEGIEYKYPLTIEFIK